MSEKNGKKIRKGLMIVLFSLIPLSFILLVVAFSTFQNKTLMVLFAALPFVIIGAFVICCFIFVIRAARHSFQAGFVPSDSDNFLMQQMHRQAHEVAMRMHQQAVDQHQRMVEQDILQQTQQQIINQTINTPPMGL